MKSFGEVLRRYLESRGLQRLAKLEEAHRLWRQICRPEWAGETRVLRYRDGTLEIGVGSSALLYELRAFWQEEVLRRVRAEGTLPVYQVRFRLLRSGEEGAW